MPRLILLALMISQVESATTTGSWPDLVRSGASPTFRQVSAARFSTTDRRAFESFATWAKDLTPAERARWLIRDGIGPDGKPRWRSAVDCAVLDSRGLARAMIATLKVAADQTTALARWQEVERAYSSGIALEERMLRKARRTAARRPTPIGRELAMRVAGDQAWRQAQFERPHDDAMAEAIAYRMGSRMCHIDADDTRWLKGVIAQGAWPLISRDGKGAANDAWLLAQHGDNDRAFQEQVLAVMQPLLAEGEADRKSYALLYDRVATNAGRPQRYATQFTTSDAGCMTAMATEDPASIDLRRRAVGLRPIGAYAKGLAKAYHARLCPNLFAATGDKPS